MVAHLLGQVGIETRIFNENAQGGMGEIPFMHVWPEVWVVDDRDSERAQQLIRELEGTDTVSQVACASCHEQNPANFQLCWNCGAQL
jgi:mono/diheme cytochrome c family protein